jgi:hypothetical protein
MMPVEGTHHLKPDPQNSVVHGEYLITACVCFDCHTPMKGGQYVEGMDFAGGMEFVMETGGVVRSANITPDSETGIGSWTREMFVRRFKAYDDSLFIAYEVPPGEFNTEMPWDYYSKLSEDELGAMYDYLQSIPPVKNQVIKFSKP